MKNKLELFVDKVNEYGGYAKMYKTKGKAKRLMAVFSLNKPQIYIARLKYGCIVVSAVHYSSYYSGKHHYGLHGYYAIADFNDMKASEERLETFFTRTVDYGRIILYIVGFVSEPIQRKKKAMEYIALDFGYYPIE